MVESLGTPEQNRRATTAFLAAFGAFELIAERVSDEGPH